MNFFSLYRRRRRRSRASLCCAIQVEVNCVDRGRDVTAFLKRVVIAGDKERRCFAIWLLFSG